MLLVSDQRKPVVENYTWLYLHKVNAEKTLFLVLTYRERGDPKYGLEYLTKKNELSTKSARPASRGHQTI